MKKIFNAVANFLLAVGVVLVFPLFGVGLCLYLPIDYIKYKRSPYYKKERKKYEAFAATGIHFKICNEILSNDLPIQVISNSKDDSVSRWWFVFGDTLIIPDWFSFEYDPESGTWQDFGEDEDGKRSIMDLDEYIQIALDEVNQQAGEPICKDGVVLIDADNLKDLEQAKKEKKFLIYHKNRAQVLKNFCNGHWDQTE